MALVLVAPRAVLTFVLEHVFRLRLDLGQRWTWAVASSVRVTHPVPATLAAKAPPRINARRLRYSAGGVISL